MGELMLACEKCLENNWSLAGDSDFVIATCKNCGNETSFPRCAPKRKPFRKDAAPALTSLPFPAPSTELAPGRWRSVAGDRPTIDIYNGPEQQLAPPWD